MDKFFFCLISSLERVDVFIGVGHLSFMNNLSLMSKVEVQRGKSGWLDAKG